MELSALEQALAALEPLVGEWTLEARDPDGKPWPGQARATFEWHPSKAHLVQRTVTGSPEAPNSISIMGCDGTAGTYVQLYSDARGVCRIYHMAIDGEEWRLRRDGEPFPQQFVGRIGEGGRTIEGRWEKAENGADFTVDFYLTYRRSDSG